MIPSLVFSIKIPFHTLENLAYIKFLLWSDIDSDSEIDSVNLVDSCALSTYCLSLLICGLICLEYITEQTSIARIGIQIAFFLAEQASDKAIDIK